MNKLAISRWDDLADRVPEHALVGNVDLVIIRMNQTVSVLYGRCLHRGALLADGHVDGDNLMCGLHNWDYRVDTGISEYANEEQLPKFNAWIEDGNVLVDLESSTGTCVNGEMIHRHALTNGDVIEMGSLDIDEQAVHQPGGLRVFK